MGRSKGVLRRAKYREYGPSLADRLTTLRSWGFFVTWKRGKQLEFTGDFVQWLVGQAGVGGLAGFALWLLDRSYRDALRREKEVIEQGREDRRQLIAVLAENAKTSTALQGTIENLARDWASRHNQPRTTGGADD